MKTGWKIFWIVCGIAAGIGFSCCVAAKVLGVTKEAIEGRFPRGIGIIEDAYDGGDWEDAEELEEDAEQKFSGVTAIEADIAAGQVEILMSEDLSDEVILKTEGVNRRLKLKYYMEGSELKIKTSGKLRYLNRLSNVGMISIYVPEDYRFEECSIEIKAGSLYIEHIQADDLSVEVDAGEAEINSFRAEEVDFDCGAGSIKAAGISGNEMDINCGVGEIIYTSAGKETDYNYEVSCGIGEINCGSSSYSGLGRSSHIDNDADRDMKIECGIGSVTVSFTNEPDL